ncbi:CDP-glucose 4,6-dehydratase [Roseicyclus mahoneyensis]|uniref:CDP-glucose 4,6-dehydratase n=1 Tax=Roseicyclus mahoneyensis TaxID=164332 RepID=A0A316GX45_9RHOB|nr:CDP-glucose 4,6-dehydratase [Roseicyclus mahoneyensis]PWK59649.1 CDP-glucose 4,6-dehydratase [Roseicyclus mahoneyensis]
MTADWHGRRVVITGHTGFKGSWLSHWLLRRGAEVFGLSLSPDTTPALFDQLGLAGRLDHRIGDIRTPGLVAERVAEVQPDAIFHLAAQPLVLRSYADPVETWSTNVMGTLNVLEAARGLLRPCALVVITTDKVYENREWPHPYREPDRLGGHDPYSASKAATELLVASHARAFLRGGPVRLATARAGNVIGGGDWAENRILPDLARALAAGRPLALRNPAAIRPWQHVLDPLAGYMTMAERMLADTPVPDAVNFGPALTDLAPVRRLVEIALRHWPGTWHDASDPDAPHEAGQLALSIELARATLGWAPRWGLEDAVARSIEWYRGLHEGADPVALTDAQITAFEASDR